MKGTPNLLGAKSSNSGLLGAQNVGVQNVKSFAAVNPGADARPAFKDESDTDSPASGLTVTSSVILACTLTVLMVLVAAFVARRKWKSQGRGQYEAVPEMATLVDNTSTRYV